MFFSCPLRIESIVVMSARYMHISRYPFYWVYARRSKHYAPPHTGNNPSGNVGRASSRIRKHSAMRFTVYAYVNTRLHSFYIAFAADWLFLRAGLVFITAQTANTRDPRDGNVKMLCQLRIIRFDCFDYIVSSEP